MLDTQPLTNVLAMNPVKRPIYADNAIQTIDDVQPLSIWTMRDTAFEALALGGSKVDTQELTKSYEGSMNIVKEDKQGGDKVSLGEAKVVVSGGRALKSKENFVMLEELAQVIC